ncbi:3051_t:CDS:2, partial [Funneliformis caledonium]
MNFALKSEGTLKSKYNVTFGQCLECAKEQRSMGWCEKCESNAFKANFKNWTSGNLVIDDLIRHTQLNTSGSVDYLEYIEFEQFDLVEYKNKSGAFSTIYSAIWLEGPRRIWDHHAGLWTRNGPIKVALKRLNDSQNISKEYLNQLYEYHHCLQIGSIVDYFGITKDPTSNYMFVMSYYENDLYSYLDEAQGTICWRDTVEMLWEISGGIEYIHENGLIHGNLHGDFVLTSEELKCPTSGKCYCGKEQS